MARWVAVVLAAAVSVFALPPAGAKVAAPDDPFFASQWHLPLIQIPQAWAVSKGAGATVAVLDTGVAFEDYADGRFSYRKAPGFSRTRFVPGYDFLDRDQHPNDNISQVPGRPAHGTHTAAIIAETSDEGEGTASIAPDSAIMPVRVLDWEGDGKAADAAAGIRFAADHGAQVLVMNLAGVDTGGISEAVSYAASKGVTMVAPSGNQGAAQVGYPASDRHVIAVGAVAVDKERAYYSNYGEGLDLVAPGGDMSNPPTSTPAEVQFPGIRQQTFVGTPDGFCHCQKEGTSSAAPQVAAVAALLVGSGLATTPDQVRNALMSSALDLGPPGPDTSFGAGLVQASSALAAAARATADLSVSIDGPSEEATSTPARSTFTVTNAGPATATEVTLTDAMSPGVGEASVLATQGGCQRQGTTVTCNLGTLAAGSTAKVTIEARPGAGSVATHDTAVGAKEADGNRENNRVLSAPTASPTWLAVAVGFGLCVVFCTAGLVLVRRHHRARQRLET